jgi:hypothetical protein
VLLPHARESGMYDMGSTKGADGAQQREDVTSRQRASLESTRRQVSAGAALFNALGRIIIPLSTRMRARVRAWKVLLYSVQRRQTTAGSRSAILIAQRRTGPSFTLARHLLTGADACLNISAGSLSHLTASRGRA